MEYTVKKLAVISKISERTLRYYDEIGLLSPKRISSNGYRIYGREEVDILQQILFYRELELSLDEIKEIITSPNFDCEKALEAHLSELIKKKNRINSLISTVEKTIRSIKGETEMTDKEKFEGFKKQMIDSNEEKYGDEIREKYGNEATDASNKKIMGMTKEQYANLEKINESFAANLNTAMDKNDPSCEEATKMCELHKQFLTLFWKEGTYTKQTHKNIAEMYISDERFTQYHENIRKGAATFLKKAIDIYCK